MVHVLTRDHQVANEHRRRRRLPGEDVQGELDHTVTVPLGEVSGGSDERRLRLAQLGPGIRFGILPHDRARARAAYFLERPGSTQGAPVVGGADEDVSSLSTFADDAERVRRRL